MLNQRVLKSVEKCLLDGNYTKLIQGLWEVGQPIKEAWDFQLKQETGKIPEKYRFSSDAPFKEFLVDRLKSYKNQAVQTNTQANQSAIQELNTKLSNLARFIAVWKDNIDNDENPLESESQQSTPIIHKKWLHQQIKFKAELDKKIRCAINIALQILVFKLFQQSEQFIKNKHWLKDFKKSRNKAALLDLIFTRIKDLNDLSDKPINLSIQPQEINKIGKAIADFQTPTIKKKLLKYFFGYPLAFIAAIACGLTTGGFIYLLGPSVLVCAIILGIFTGSVALQFKGGYSGFAIALLCGVGMGAAIYSLCLLLTPASALLFSAICLSGLTGSFGFVANFGFFKVNFPNFLLKLRQKGGITEYIDKNGKRRQFSATYKWLLTPLFFLASLTVGAGTVALTYLTILKLLGTILPALAVLWPPLPIVISAVLAAAIGITLLVSTFTASLEILKKVAALDLGFVALCKYTYENCKEWFKNLGNLTTSEKVGLFILLILLPVALLGLVYFRYTAGVDLAELIGSTGAIVMGVVAYIAQIAFTCLSINKLKNAIINFSTAAANDFPALIANAIGNAVLVFCNSLLSILGMIACFINSFSGNMSEPNMFKESKEERTETLGKKFNNRFTKAEKTTAESPEPPENVLQPPTKGHNMVNEPQESKQRTKPMISHAVSHDGTTGDAFSADSSTKQDPHSTNATLATGSCITSNASMFPVSPKASNDFGATEQGNPKTSKLGVALK